MGESYRKPQLAAFPSAGLCRGEILAAAKPGNKVRAGTGGESTWDFPRCLKDRQTLGTNTLPL